MRIEEDRQVGEKKRERWVGGWEGYLGEVGGVGQVTVVEEEVGAGLVSVLVEVLDAVGVEGGGTADDLGR